MGAPDDGLLDAAIDERLFRFLDGTGTAEDAEAVRAQLNRARTAPELQRYLQQIFGLGSRFLILDRLCRRDDALRAAFLEFRRAQPSATAPAFAKEWDRFTRREWKCWAGGCPPDTATALQSHLFTATRHNRGRSTTAKWLRRILAPCLKE